MEELLERGHVLTDATVKRTGMLRAAKLGQPGACPRLQDLAHSSNLLFQSLFTVTNISLGNSKFRVATMQRVSEYHGTVN